MQAWKTRLLVRESLFTAASFTAALYSYFIIAGWGVRDHFMPGPLRDYLNSPFVHVELLGAGVLFGGLLGAINRIAETPWLRQRSVGQVVLVRTGLYLLGFAIMSAIVMVIFGTLIYSWARLAAISRAMTVQYTLSFAFWLVLVVAFINLTLEVERVIGPGDLWRLFVGRYKRPREEERVFLFMDLVGSTTAAETLGHTRYSEMLQECYRDLTEVVMRHRAAIYQYVGDEVVMSWRCSGSAVDGRAAVRAFFSYRETLLARADLFERRFGMIPRFRGGIAAGPVTAIEVGDVKREIVYHGDVLNTAARLLEVCKARNEYLLVSRPIGESVRPDTGLREGWHGRVPLRGKRDPVEASSFRPPSE